MNAFLLVFAPLLLAYATALWWCIELWLQADGYHGHGPLLPVLAALVLWSRRATWARQPAAPDRRGLWLLAPALLLHLAAAALTIDSLSAASMILAVPGAAWLAFGRARLRGLWPVLWLTALAVPQPLFVTGRLAFELKELAMRGGIWLCHGTGLAVVRDGAQLTVPGQAGALAVADACGGLRSLLAMLTVAYCVAFFLGPARSGRRIGLLLAAMPLAIGVNMLRIAAICWAAAWNGVAFASGAGHTAANVAAWLLDLAVVAALNHWWSRGADAAVPAPSVEVLPGPIQSLRPVGLGLWLLAAPLLLLSLYRPIAESAGRAAALPERLLDFVEQQNYPLPDHTFELLGTRDATWRRYADGSGAAVYVVAVFHAANWKSLHPPHICLEGSDMTIVDDGALELADGSSVGRLLLRSNRDQRPYLSLYAYVAADLCTGSYSRFFWHHLPKALLRHSNAGFLLRVETFADDGAAAEARCARLFTALLPAGREALR